MPLQMTEPWPVPPPRPRRRPATTATLAVHAATMSFTANGADDLMPLNEVATLSWFMQPIGPGSPSQRVVRGWHERGVDGRKLRTRTVAGRVFTSSRWVHAFLCELAGVNPAAAYPGPDGMMFMPDGDIAFAW